MEKKDNICYNVLNKSFEVKAMARFFDKNIERRCEYCAKGYLSADGKNILCKRKGVVEKGYSCLGFDYDPLKRIPLPSVPEIPQFDPEEFKI